MKSTLLIFLATLLSFGCSTGGGNGVSKELQAQSNRFEASQDPKVQYNQAVAMVKNSADFSENQKKKLIDLIGQFALRSNDLRMQQTQYRAVLINEMLDNQGTTKLKPSQADESLQRLNAQRSKNLEAFIQDFQEIAGEQSRNHHALMLQTLDIY